MAATGLRAGMVWAEVEAAGLRWSVLCSRREAAALPVVPGAAVAVTFRVQSLCLLGDAR